MSAPEKRDPTAPLNSRTPDELGSFVDDHLIMALVAADLLSTERQEAEDYIRDRLVAISDSWPDCASLEAEERRRRMARLRAMLATGGVVPPA